MVKFNPPWEGPPIEPDYYVARSKKDLPRSIIPALEEGFAGIEESVGIIDWAGGELRFTYGPMLGYHTTPAGNWPRVEVHGLVPWSSSIHQTVLYGGDKPSPLVFFTSGRGGIEDYLEELSGHQEGFKAGPDTPTTRYAFPDIWYILKIKVSSGAVIVEDPSAVSDEGEVTIRESWVTDSPIPPGNIKLIAWAELNHQTRHYIAPEHRKGMSPDYVKEMERIGWYQIWVAPKIHWQYPRNPQVDRSLPWGEPYTPEWRPKSRPYRELRE